MSACWSRMKTFYISHGLKLYKFRHLKKNTPSSSFIKKYLSTSCSQCREAKQSEQVMAQYTVPTKLGNKKDTTIPLPKTHSPEFVEAAWYDWWVQQGFFSPKTGSQSREKFVLCLPPPNVTGTLHLGHALTCSIQDALVRWHRMHGHETVWIPGCDHAGIATQVVVEKQLWREQGKTRHDLGREKFLQAVWEWKNKKGDTIYEQLRRLGASLDWSRAAFTMDEGMCEAVTEAFVRLHDEGLIFRGNRLVNWSCQLKSAISDIEVENVSLDKPTKLTVPGYTKPQKFGEMAYFDYPVVDSDESITVATTRLETMLGDTGVAVHPDDSRYRHLHGKFLLHPLDGRHIPVVTDKFVDRQLGTGAVKITPSHDPNDFEMGHRHGLPFINVINDDGLMENVAATFVGMKRFDARRKVEEELRKMNLFREKKPHPMTLPICSRSGDIIEPRIKSQWFVDCSSLSDMAIQCVQNGDLKFVPDYYKKVWVEFLKEGRSWCISRQIWWGHRIPAYRVIIKENQLEEELWVSGRSLDEACIMAEQQLGLSRDQFSLLQDEDVLDTWFSSALFPFSVNGWPHQTEDCARFYPNSLLETGNDIIFFWVARMVMMGCKLTGQLPFREVLLHGTLRDAAGRKMSKSLGNVIDPMAVIEGTTIESLQKQLDDSNLDPREIEVAKKNQRKDFPQGIPRCGADALRFALCSYNFKDMEINMNVVHVQSYKNFCNKIWQAFKYVMDKLPTDFKPVDNIQSVLPGTKADRWILSRLSCMVQRCDTTFKDYDLHFTTKALYEFWFSDFCDVYLEYTKLSLQSGDDAAVQTTCHLLHLCVETFLRALSPFMPYLTEELYQRLPARGDNPPESICVAPYPIPEQYSWRDEQLDEEMDIVQETCTGIMSIIQGYNLPRKTAEAYIHVSPEMERTLSQYLDICHVLTKIPSITIVTSDAEIPHGSIPKIIRPEVEVLIKVEGTIDFEAEISRIEKRLKAVEVKVEMLNKRADKLNANNSAIPADITDQMEQLHKEAEKLKSSANSLKKLSKS